MVGLLKAPQIMIKLCSEQIHPTFVTLVTSSSNVVGCVYSKWVGPGQSDQLLRSTVMWAATCTKWGIGSLLQNEQKNSDEEREKLQADVLALEVRKCQKDVAEICLQT